MRQHHVGDAVHEDAATKTLLFPRLTSCTRRCHSNTLHVFCLARCLANATTAAAGRPRASVRGPTVSERYPWSLLSRTGCPENVGGPPCDSNAEQPSADAAGAKPSLAVDGWLPASSPRVSSVLDARPTSKRGYNDVVDLCIAINCPHAEPNSLDFMKCIRQYSCM